MILGVMLIVVIAAVAYAATRPHGEGAHDRGADGHDQRDLERWVQAGLVTADQAEAIAAFEAARSEPEDGSRGVKPLGEAPAAVHRSRVPVVAEALGYLGGILAGVGVVLVVVHYWDEFALGVQIGLTAGASLAMVGVGTVIGRADDPAFTRMQAFMWAASSAAAGACAVVVAHLWIGSDDPATLTLATAAVVGVQSALLWRGRVLPVQQAIALAAAATAVGGATAMVAPEGWWGVTVWLAGLAMVAVGLTKRGTTPDITEAIGAVALVVGAITVASQWPSGGNIFLVATALGLAAVALVPWPVADLDRWILGAIGAAATLMSVPGTVAWYAQQAGAVAGAVVWLFGAGLLALGLANRVHLPRLAQGLGASAMFVGAAVTAAQWPSLAPAVGLVTAIGLLVIGSRPGAVLESLVGALGLLIYVPWAVGRWFPGESRTPILLVVSGVLILGVALLIGRMGGRMRRELRSQPRPTPSR